MNTRAKNLPTWAYLSLATNCILIFAIALLIGRQQELAAFFKIVSNPSTLDPDSQSKAQAATSPAVPKLGPRHKLSYWQWVDVLKQEAKVAAQKNPQRLTILAGDSLSLWFPSELLPKDRNWLNQGISGEKTTGLLNRLDLFNATNPETIFVMIGINDLIRGVSDETILENQQQIVRSLRKNHATAQIVVQSILPHGVEQVTWEGKEKLLAIPNSRIRQLNQQLEHLAKKEGVRYLDLYPLFANSQGNLRPELSTDGLHLSQEGYLVWSSAIQLYSQIKLQQTPKMAQQVS
ncbi:MULTISPECIES: SGNH/GDSL hydrolase family protein [Nostocales]|uniref:G-D-S-L family lipolytic protein n=3 Tax=Nostocales TaxID=1161 RepID=A0A0C1R6J8_9CYAN|nr:SGNH/GDSL hydrolase family protein [Tolypothrix bouteillei]KAF3887397.1 G-D-S-L family lipolytic protein [Tolypothrix bouteillei VB521301]